MKKHIEIKTYEYFDIKVMVRINYDEKTISLGQDYSNFRKKDYVFFNRELQYMQGWLNILDGIKYAVEQARKELEEYIVEEQKAKNDLVERVLMEASDIVQKRDIKNSKKKK